MPEIAGRQYEVIVGSDVAERDGLYLELNGAGEQIVQVFYSDADGLMTFTAFKTDLPLVAVEWAIAEGEARLIPTG